VLHYPGLLSSPHSSGQDSIAIQAHNLFEANNWETQWIFRYGSTQTSHYHSGVHECMAVLTGTARIRFGTADTSDDMHANTHGDDHESGGVYVDAEAGDVFILPAGTAHKTFDTSPSAEFKLLTPGDGHHHSLTKGGHADARQTLESIELDGFTMVGAYPKGGGEWDFAKGGEDEGAFEKVWSVPKPERDPVLGMAEEGLVGQWK
jgi:uncharacterized protein YjlB